MGKRVGMISLGCAKNQVNAEQMLYRLQQAGYTLQEDVDGADLVIVNTCGLSTRPRARPSTTFSPWAR